MHVKNVHISLAERPSYTTGGERSLIKYQLVLSGGTAEERAQVFEYLQNSPWSTPFMELRSLHWWRVSTGLLRSAHEFMKERLPHMLRPEETGFNPFIERLTDHIAAYLGELHLLMEDGSLDLAETGRISCSEPNLSVGPEEE